MRKKTGWEDYRQDPSGFIRDILQLNINEFQIAMLEGLADGSRSRLGLVLHEGAVEDPLQVDHASLAVAVALWSASALHRPTILWGGRRSNNNLWLKHALAILSGARPEFVRGHRIISDQPTCGIKMPNGAWAIRYDGPFREDAMKAVEDHGGHVEILIGDFDWLDSDSFADAVACERDGDSLLTLVILGEPRHR